MHSKAVITAAVIMVAVLAGTLVIGESQASGEEDQETTYTLTYHLGDASVQVTSEETAFTILSYDDSKLGFTLPSGKEFEGWNTAENGSGTSYAVGSTYTIQGDGVTTADLYAVLKDKAPETDVFRFDVNGTIYSQTLTISESGQITLPTIEALGASVPAGMEFKGWVVGTQTYAAGSVVSASVVGEDEAFKAEFSAIVYTVAFDIDGTRTTVSGTSADTIVFPADPVKAGYTFKGWAIDGQIIEDTEGIRFSADVTYTAVFVEDYALTFEVDGTVLNGGTVSKPIIPSDPTREGYTFAGWSVDGVAVIQDIEAYIRDVEGPTAFIAVFQPVDCIVTFEVDGETVLTQTVKYGDRAVEPALVPEMEGYDFAGWDFDFGRPITADTVIEALWTETPEPEPTGLDDPMTLMIVIVVVIVVVALLMVAYWQRQAISARLVNALTKKGGKEE